MISHGHYFNIAATIGAFDCGQETHIGSHHASNSVGHLPLHLLDTNGAIGNGIWGIIDSKRKAEVEEEDSRSSVGTWENDTSVVVYPARKGAA